MTVSHQAAYSAKQSAKNRAVSIHPFTPAELRKRKKLESNIFDWLEYFYPESFYNPWTDNQREMVSAIFHCAKYGNTQAIAAPRGEGKTTLGECAITYSLLTGLMTFPLIVAAAGEHSDRILSNIKSELEFNENLGDEETGLYRDVCTPIRALEGAPQRCNMQTVGGERTQMKWSGGFIKFPTISEDYWKSIGQPKGYKYRCGGSILMTRGLDAAMRGIRMDRDWET